MASRVMALLFTVAFAAQLGVGLISPLLPVYAQSLGASGLWLGVIFAVFSLARVVAMPLVGRYSDAHGRRKLIVFGLLAYALLSLAYILANSPETLTVIRFAHGASSALVIPVAMAYVGDLAPKGWEGRYLGVFNVATFLGIGFGPLLGGVFADAFGMNSAFIAMGGLSLVNLAFVVVELPESTAARRAGPRVPYRKLLANRPVQAVLTYRMVNAFGQGMVMSFLPVYAVGALGIPLSMVGLVLSSRMLALSVLQGPCGVLADRRNRVAMVLVGGAVFVSALFAMPLATDAAQLLAINVLGAVGSALSIAAATAITTACGRGMGMGTLMGLYNAYMSMGMTLGPLLGGLVFDVLGVAELFHVGGAICGVGLATFFWLVRGCEEDAIYGGSRGRPSAKG